MDADDRSDLEIRMRLTCVVSNLYSALVSLVIDADDRDIASSYIDERLEVILSLRIELIRVEVSVSVGEHRWLADKYDESSD